MATTKLGLFNGALTELGARRLDDTGATELAAQELVAVYDQTVEECLKAGSWNFAMETIEAAADTGVTPEFGFTEVFAKPSDWLRTVGLSADEYLHYPLSGNQVYDDGTFWSTDVTPIYVRYVSGDTGLGLELTRWPADFARYVQLELACRVCERVTQSASRLEKLETRRDKARRTALNHDAMNEGQPKFMPPGSWTRARGGRTGRGGDRGSSGSLTG